jgi:hypothetical protein
MTTHNFLFHFIEFTLGSYYEYFYFYFSISCLSHNYFIQSSNSISRIDNIPSGLASTNEVLRSALIDARMYNNVFVSALFDLESPNRHP